MDESFFDEDKEYLANFICKICGKVPINPITNPFSHIFCKICVDRKEGYSELDERVKKLHRILRVKIEDEKVCSLDEFLNNKFNRSNINVSDLISCPKGCGAKMNKNEINEHDCIQYLKGEHEKFDQEKVELEETIRKYKELISKQEQTNTSIVLEENLQISLE
jgi:hypothetical protein